VQNLTTDKRRNAWFSAYITTILQRDVQDIAQIAGLHELPRLLSLIAAQSGALLNLSSLARDAGLVLMTLKRYVTVLEAAFLIIRLPAWFRNIGKRLIKAPKIYLTDTGLFSYLTGIDAKRLQTDPRLIGQLTESCVMQELVKQVSWSEMRPNIFYCRSAAGREIDFILENRSGQIVAIEVKASAQVTSTDFKALQELKELLGPQFVRGIVLYAGESTVPFGDDLLAVPLSAFWLLPETL
jgi:predicted AAA+ superfamily ATPase